MHQSFLRFSSDPEGRLTLKQFGWIGEWPPPERMCLCVGRTSGDMTASEPDQVDEICGYDPEAFDMAIEVRHYQRASFSKLTDAAAEHPNVARGALYVPVEAT